MRFKLKESKTFRFYVVAVSPTAPCAVFPPHPAAPARLGSQNTRIETPLTQARGAGSLRRPCVENKVSSRKS